MNNSALPRTGAVKFSDVKIFGERSTSTTALKLLIEQNSNARVLPSVVTEIDTKYRWIAKVLTSRALRERYIDYVFDKVQGNPRLAWKHAAPIFYNPRVFYNTLVIFTVRHPVSWMLAMHKRPHHAMSKTPTAFCDFALSGWKTLGRERLDGVTLNVADLYNEKMRAVLTMARRLEFIGAPFLFVRFEDFAIKQDAVFGKIKPYLHGAFAEFRPLSHGTKNPSETIDFYSDYYGNDRWRDKLSDPDLIVEGRIDWPLIERFGYQRVRSGMPVHHGMEFVS